MQSNRIGESALARANKLSANAAERLHHFLNVFIHEHLDSNIAGGAMIEIDALVPEQRRQVVLGRDKVDLQLRALIRAGVADGGITAEDQKLLIFSFMGAINWIPSWFSPDGDYSSSQIAEHIARILMNGVRSRR